jgi:hypothetical protein
MIPMNTNAREVQAPESYATFWGPVAGSAPAVPPVLVPADAKDADQQFTNATDDASGAPRAEHP